MNCQLIIPNLYLGSMNDAQHPSLLTFGINHVLSLTFALPKFTCNIESNDESNQQQSKQPRCKLLAVFDSNQQSLMPFFQEAFDFIDEARNGGNSILIHCEAGISRSPTVTIAYLMYRMKMSLQDAYALVKSKRTIISPNLNFMGQLVELERKLRVLPIFLSHGIFVEQLLTPVTEYKPFVVETAVQPSTISNDTLKVSLPLSTETKQELVANSTQSLNTKCKPHVQMSAVSQPSDKNTLANQSNQVKSIELQNQVLPPLLLNLNEKLVSRKRELSLPLVPIAEPQVTSSQNSIVRRFAIKKSSIKTRLSLNLKPMLPLSPPSSPNDLSPADEKTLSVDCTPILTSKCFPTPIKPQFKLPIASIDCAPLSPPVSPPIKPTRPSSLLVTPWPSLRPQILSPSQESLSTSINSNLPDSKKSTPTSNLSLELLLLKRRKLPIENDSRSSIKTLPMDSDCQFNLCQPKKMKNVVIEVN